MIPVVIEPSFGIGRILQAVLEHSFYVRGQSGAAGAANCDVDAVSGVKNDAGNVAAITNNAPGGASGVVAG